MQVLIVGDTGLPDLPPGRVVDVEERRARVLIRQGYARPAFPLESEVTDQAAPGRADTRPGA